MSHIPTVKLSNNYEMPIVGLGTYNEEDENNLVNAIKVAVKAGYRHFDCAYIYYNLKAIGRGVKEAIAESEGALKREDFFIVSKCWNACHSKEKVNENLNVTLESFGFDYIDLFLVHWPMGFKENTADSPTSGGPRIGIYKPEDFPVDDKGFILPSDVHYVDTYKYLEELVTLGKVKSIGVSNFNIKQLKDVLDACKIRPVCNQIEVHPLLKNQELVEFCQKENVVVVAYAPLGGPGSANWSKNGEPAPLENPIIKELAKKYNKTTGQIILKWLLTRNIVVIPKSVTPKRIADNCQLFDFTLAEEDIKLFDENFKEQHRFYSFDECVHHPFYPF